MSWRRVVQWVAAVAFVCTTLAHLWTQYRVDPVGIMATIALPLPALMVWFAVSTRRWHRESVATLAGLAFSWLGDGLGAVDLRVKIAMFLVAQICYAVAFWPTFRRTWGPAGWWRVGLVAVPVAVMVAVVAPRAGSLAVPVVAYGLVIAVMALCATSLGPLATAGGLLFLVSDAMLGGQEFAGWYWKFQGLAIMATYLVAQGCLARAVAVRSSSSSDDLPPSG
ncbi:MAG TPA: lysoplasmalogenase [Candidatus Avipropionibacterium avicola]|uniref:Lysoplasmalogenase n=1 Tax=Candidatus Avipropionibacterium avicola TaxID=2840701 RepID=A0A9D1KN24_9ACTN|nr:lysoplasmalogenase [Candidatus Avipropionibacterium avicola]